MAPALKTGLWEIENNQIAPLHAFNRTSLAVVCLNDSQLFADFQMILRYHNQPILCVPQVACLIDGFRVVSLNAERIFINARLIGGDRADHGSNLSGGGKKYRCPKTASGEPALALGWAHAV